MAKTRASKKEARRLFLKQRHSEGVLAAEKVKNFAMTLERQSQLDAWLIPMEDVERRKQLYQYVKPFLKFDSTFPSMMTPSRIILP